MHSTSAPRPGEAEPFAPGEMATRPVKQTTEITVVGSGPLRVEGDAKDVERLILDAARGSIMELAWVTDSDTGERLGVNPQYVVALRAVGS